MTPFYARGRSPLETEDRDSGGLRVGIGFTSIGYLAWTGRALSGDHLGSGCPLCLLVLLLNHLEVGIEVYGRQIQGAQGHPYARVGIGF